MDNTNKDENSEFRDVHAARALLECYIKSGKNLDVVKSLPIYATDRYDVWQCVFEKEPEAYAILQEKELYHLLMKYKDMEGDYRSMSATLCVITLTNFVEWKSPLSVDKAIKIILDILGDEMLKYLLDEAKICYDSRVEIVKPYHKHDDVWVGYAKTILDKLMTLKPSA